MDAFKVGVGGVSSMCSHSGFGAYQCFSCVEVRQKGEVT